MYKHTPHTRDAIVLVVSVAVVAESAASSLLKKKQEACEVLHEADSTVVVPCRQNALPAAVLVWFDSAVTVS